MPIADMHEMVERFNREVINLPIPSAPMPLTGSRLEFAIDHLQEELDEFKEGGNEGDIDKMADALVDMTYVALGRLVEMGIAPRAVFEEVHAANMRKRRGEVGKRPGSLGHDAIKPEGWQPPDLEAYLKLTRRQVLTMASRPSSDPETPRKPKILVVGHARHGKDTVCEFLRDKYGFTFTSSSQVAAEKIIWPRLKDRPQFDYVGPIECFADRHNHRALWYQLIQEFNTPDPTALGRLIFQENDVYCGLRSRMEFNGLRNAGLFDVAIWVDALDRVVPEAKTSNTVEPWMADYVLDNNGSLQDLDRNLEQLMATILLGKER